METAATTGALVAGIALALLGRWLDRRERPLGSVPLVPPFWLTVAGVLVVVLMLAHLVTLLTGVPLRPRGAPGP